LRVWHGAAHWALAGLTRGASLGAFIFVWHLAAVRFANPVLLPTPWRVAEELLLAARAGELGVHAIASLARLAVGFGVALVLGVALGLAIGLSRQAERLIDPAIELIRPISAIAWIPIALFMFGIGDVLPAFIIAYAAFFPIVLNTIAGVRGTDRNLVSAALTMGLRPPSMIGFVVLPSSLPRILTGVRLGATASVLALIASELVGAPEGLGFAIQWFGGILDTPSMLAYIAAVSALGFLADILLRALQRRVTPWATDVKEAR
jgi:ABC-type nitrate/sulfonate/bicarbonate transport system permease component